VLHVVDGAHPDPEEQVRAVREVLAEVGADRLPELLVVNKVDAATQETLLRLKHDWPDAIFMSAQSGVGLDELRTAIEDRLPRPAIELSGLIPYDHGQLVDRIHRTGEVLESSHPAGGTQVRARVSADLAAELVKYRITEEEWAR
jgi:GTP-binding protein HflX